MIASTTGEIVIGLLPFVLLFGFWILLARNTRLIGGDSHQPVVEKLEEIRQELERLRRAIEERSL